MSSSKDNELVFKGWQIRRDGGDPRPINEKQVRSELSKEPLSDTVEFRQGNGRWFPASEVKEIYEQLRSNGYYVNDGDRVHGPYVKRRLEQLFDQGFFTRDRALIRRGLDGKWSNQTDFELDDLARKVFLRMEELFLQPSSSVEKKVSIQLTQVKERAEVKKKAVANHTSKKSDELIHTEGALQSVTPAADVTENHHDEIVEPHCLTENAGSNPVGKASVDTSSLVSQEVESDRQSDAKVINEQKEVSLEPTQLLRKSSLEMLPVGSDDTFFQPKLGGPTEFPHAKSSSGLKNSLLANNAVGQSDNGKTVSDEAKSYLERNAVDLSSQASGISSAIAPKSFSESPSKKQTFSADQHPRRPSFRAERRGREFTKTGAILGNICLDCGGPIDPKKGHCRRCRGDRKREPEALHGRGRNQSEVQTGWSALLSAELEKFRHSPIGKVFAVFAAFLTAGVFLSLGVVRAITWSTSHSADQQFYGWVALGLGFVLLAVATIAANLDLGRNGPGFRAIGLTLCGITFLFHYARSTGELRSADAEVREQVEMWTKMMESEGYGGTNVSDSIAPSSGASFQQSETSVSTPYDRGYEESFRQQMQGR